MKTFSLSLEKDIFALLQTDWWSSYFTMLPTKLKNLIIDRTKPATFLDELIVVPTVSGLPLNLKILGESLFASKYETSLNFEALFSNDEGIHKDMSLKLFPNVASTLSARMSIGPEAFEAGFQLEGNLQLSAALDLRLEKRPGHIHLQYDFQDVRSFDVHSKLNWVASNGKISPRKFEIRSHLQTPTQMYYNSCADENFRQSWISSEILGLKYCYYIKLPRGLSLRNFWLQGPIAFGVNSEKIDPGMKGYVLDIETQDTEETSSIKFTWDAPGSSKNRKVVLLGSYSDSPQHVARVNLEFSSEHSPIMATATFHDTDTQKGITATLKHGMEENTHLFNCFIEMIRPNDKEIIYKPIVSRSIGNTDFQINYLNGTLSREVGKSLDVDLSLKLGRLLRSFEIRGLVLADRRENGDFEYELRNGRISLTIPHRNSFELEVGGKFFNHQPILGFELKSLYGREEPDTDLVVRSELKLIPYQILALNTKSNSAKVPEHNINFSFLADLELPEETNESKFTVQSSLENYWNIEAIRKAGSTTGSLELNVDVASWGRKIVLLTQRNHVDLDNLTQFDFESYLKWDAGRDESKKMAVKVYFLRNDTSGKFSFFESKNEVTFISQKHQGEMQVKVPTDRTNGEYLVNIGYISPAKANYNVVYRNLIASESSSNVRSEINVVVNLPKLKPIVGSWEKSLRKTSQPHYEFVLGNNFTIVMGEDELMSVALSGKFVDYGQHSTTSDITFIQLSKYLNAMVSTSGRLIPLHFRLKNEIRIYVNKGFDAQLELAKSMSTRTVMTGDRRGIFSLKFQPNIQVEDRNCTVEVSWTSGDPEKTFIIRDFSFSNHFASRFASLQDFKVLNDGSLRLPSGTTTWSKKVELSRSQLSSTVIIRPPRGPIIINLNAGLQSASSTSGRQVFIKISSQIYQLPDFNLNFKTNIHNPRQLINLSMSVDQTFQFTLEHSLQHNSSTTDTIYNSVIAANTYSGSNELKLKNEIILLPFEIRIQSECYLNIGRYFNIDSIFEGKLSKSAENENKWYTVVALKKRRGKNEIPNGDDEHVLRIAGPIYVGGKFAQATVLIEWPAVLQNRVLLRTHADFSMEENQLGTNLMVNLSGYDKKVSLEELQKHPKISNLADPEFNTQTGAVAISSFNVRTLLSLLGTRGRKLVINFRSSSGPHANFKLPPEINVVLEQNGGTKTINLVFKLKDAEDDEDRQYSCIISSLNSVDGGVHQRKLKILTVRNSKTDGGLVNITSGFLWTSSTSGNGLQQNNGMRTKALCVVAERTIVEDHEDFGTCTLGFNSKTNIISGEEDSLDLKLILLDRIGFQGLKLRQRNLLVLNSSFWLDSVDKPGEVLKFSIVKKRVLRNEDVDPGNTFWGPDHAGQFYATAQHPFFLKELQIKTSIGPDPDDWDSSNIKGLLELNVFEQENDKIVAQVEISSEKQKTAGSSEDIFGFYDMDNDYSGVTDVDVVKPRTISVLVVSEGLDLHFKADGKTDFSTGLSYSLIDRNLEMKEGKLLFRSPSLVNSNVFQVGATPIVTIGFGGIPTINILDPNSDDELTLEYHASPQSTFRLFSKDFPENQFYSLTFPPKEEDEFLLELNFDNSTTTTTKIIDLNVALNTSKLLQLRSEWNLQAMGTTWEDIKRLHFAVYEGIKTEAKNISREINLNLRHYCEKIFTALPSFQPLLEKLDREIQEDLEEIRSSSYSNVVYERISSSLLQAYHKVKALSSKARQAVSSLTSNVLMRTKQLGMLSVDDIPSVIVNWTSRMAEEAVSATFLAIGSIKKACWESARRFSEYVESNPELKRILADAKDYLGRVQVVLQNIFRKLLHKTIALRPYLRYLLPKEAHDFLITLKHYYLGKLEPKVFGESERNSSLVTSEQVLTEGYNAAITITRRALEGKGFLFQKKKESMLIQFPLLKPVRRLREVITSTELVRPKYTQSFQDFFQWITNADVNDSRSPRWSTIKARIENAFVGGVGPDDAIGTIIGGKFYRTFDGKFHRFESSCQYLLAADFLHDNITVHLEGGSESSNMPELTLSDNEDSVSILQNYSVEYKGHPVEIAFTDSLAKIETTELGPFSAVRYNVIGSVIEISKKYSGITMACLMDYPVCTIRFKSYLYGRGLGLLGTNNLEHYDDFSTPSGEIVGKTSKFYRSWRLNRECRETKGNPPEREAPEEVKKFCSDIFAAETSPLRSCFSIVHPSDFQEVCEAIAIGGTANITKSVCSVAASYWIECRERHVPVNFVPECEII